MASELWQSLKGLEAQKYDVSCRFLISLLKVS